MPTDPRSARALRWATGLTLVSLAVAAQAADRCAVTSRSQAVAVVVCAPTAGQKEWREAGTAACKGPGSCNAWIWNDAAKAPSSAPAKDADLPKSQSGEASAVWVGDAANLIVLRKTK